MMLEEPKKSLDMDRTFDVIAFTLLRGTLYTQIGFLNGPTLLSEWANFEVLKFFHLQKLAHGKKSLPPKGVGFFPLFGGMIDNMIYSQLF